MVEISTLDIAGRWFEGNVAPDGTPETCTVDGNNGYTVLEDKNGKFSIAAILDLVVLLLEILGREDFVKFEVGDLLPVRTHQESLPDFLAVFIEDSLVADLLKVSLGGELGRSQHLGMKGESCGG